MWHHGGVRRAGGAGVAWLGGKCWYGLEKEEEGGIEQTIKEL